MPITIILLCCGGIAFATAGLLFAAGTSAIVRAVTRT